MKEGRLTPTPMGGRSPEDVLPTVMRRLCIFRYRCRLCGSVHQTQQYVSAPVETMEEYRAQVDRIVGDAGAVGPMVAGAAAERHEQIGDLAELEARAQRDGLFQGAIFENYLVTDEETYTCAGCGTTFPSNQKLTDHVDARKCGE